ncbi:hypothetical protein B484DRAFT_405358 [Ochromonadaceae sp. CCMP2298]|nr:hypothetical protein B484DRAFT_405358 [Ochromonadaceae sp. CCMP2298]
MRILFTGVIDGISVRRLQAQFGTGESDMCDIDAALVLEMEKTSRRRAAKGQVLVRTTAARPHPAPSRPNSCNS